MSLKQQAKTVTAPMAGDVAEYRFEYDFAADAGAIGALDLIVAGEDLIIESAHAHVLTAVTSGGSATVIWGVTDDTDRFANLTQGAKAELTVGKKILPPVVEGTPNVLATPYVLPKDAKISQTIGTAALTAGKIQYVVRVRKA